LRLKFDFRPKLEFHGSKVNSGPELLLYRELDGAVGLTKIAGDVLTDAPPGDRQATPPPQVGEPIERRGRAKLGSGLGESARRLQILGSKGVA